MVEQGEDAPAFRLPGIENGVTDTYDLYELTGQGKAVLLVFYPFDFSPVCTNELCAIRDAEWFELTPDLEVWAISSDSVHAHRAFAEKYDLNFPLLSDSHGSVATWYDVCYDQWEDHECVPRRGVILVSADNTIRYVWQTDDAYKKPDFFPVKEAIDDLRDDRDDFDIPEVEIAVEYDAGPGEVR